MRYTTPYIITAGMLAALSTQALAQWSTDSTDHVVVADGVGEQVQPKLAPAPDGGTYVSWYSSETGYDVRLQHLDADGNALWAHNGILVADRGFSSTQDYGLDVDASGHAVLVFRDDRFTGVQVTAQRIAPDGTATWGPNGIQFGNGSDFVASPDIATTDDGFTVVGWINNSDTNLAKINPEGTVMWNSSINTDGGPGVNLASMHGSDNGSVIVSWVQFSAFFDPKHMYAQKIDADGNEAWKSRAAVLDGGSLQFGNFPEFSPDGSGGAVFSWYDTAAGLNVYAQHLDTNGVEQFAHNGQVVSTAPRERVAPSASYDPGTGSVLVSWIELDNNQGSSGIFAQRLDATGNRMWGDTGVEIHTIDANESGTINTQMMDGQFVTFWIENNGGFAQDQVLAHALNSDGSNSWADLGSGASSGTVVMASDLAERARLTTTVTDEEMAVAAWQIGDFGVADLETHNLNSDGTLGPSAMPCLADLTGDGELDFFDVSDFLDAFGAQDPIADFTGDGEYDFFDVSDFLDAFGAGCP